MDNKKFYSSFQNFVWWTAIVENNVDPLMLGRVQCRIFGWHSKEKNMIPTLELPWAQPILPANVGQFFGVPKPGDHVFGFFMDAESGQFPFYMGIIPDIPEIRYPETEGFSDAGLNMEGRPIPYSGSGGRRPYDLNEPTTSRLARNENLDKTPIKSHQYSTYNAKYPNNNSMQTECGHYFDLDDTPGEERITLIHKKGSMIEFDKKGNVFIYAKKNFTIVAEENILIQSNQGSIAVNAKLGSVGISAKGNITESAAGDIVNTGANIKLN